MKGSAKAVKGVPLLDLGRQYVSIKSEVLAAMERVCASQQFVLGPEVEALEGEFATLTSSRYAIGCASGTDALWLALAAAGVKPGDRVITSPFSFFASASSIVRAGAEPVFVDVEPGTLNLDAGNVRAKLDATFLHKGRNRPLAAFKSESRFPVDSLPSLTRSGQALTRPRGGRVRDDIGHRKGEGPSRIIGILPVHLYGQCADMDALAEIATEHELTLIEDAAQAIGAKWQGRAAGSMGSAAAFSFYPTKNISAFGEAGIVTTQNEAVAKHMRQLRNHGSPERYLHTEFGWNARMDAIQAAVLRVKLKYLAHWTEQRRDRAATYDRLLEKAGLSTGKKPVITPLQRRPRAFHVFHQYVVRANKRDALRKFLSERAIGTEVYYPTPLHLQPVFAYLGYRSGDLPESEQAAKEVLALPMFPELTKDEQEIVVHTIADFYS